MKRALISVSDKTDLNRFAPALVELGYELYSTGGTAASLRDLGLAVVDVSEYTGSPEMMDGRVKTLHPLVHGALLGRPDLPDDAKAIEQFGIRPFSVVCVNLYPFVETIAKPNITVEEAIEQIDIGGPSMIRSAAKNHKYVAVVTSPKQYEQVLLRLANDELDFDFRRELALAAFEMTARYDRAIADYFSRVTSDSEDVFPAELQPHWVRRDVLRYGENPHQRAAFFSESTPAPGSISAARQLHGKALSYNNLLDADAALCLIREFSQPACCVIKHTNPCGCAIAERLAEAFAQAYEGDPVSAFGSIIGFNREVDAETARLLAEPGRFVEAIVAPGFSNEAREILTTVPKWKNNVRLLACEDMDSPPPAEWDYRKISGGMLVQDRDVATSPAEEWQCVSQRTPTESERRDLTFAWHVCRHVKSNAIVFAKDGAITGVGAGQMSRLDSSAIAARKSAGRASGGVVASDAFFPFRDGVDEAAGAGIRAIIQPGGSRNDEEVIAAADEHDMAMLFTGRRHFRH